MKITTRIALADWLDQLAQEASLIAPREVDGVLLYRAVTSSNDIQWEYTRPALSLKEAFFPPTERLMTIEKGRQLISLSETLPEEKQVAFGVRPCDARGVKLMEALFSDNAPVDPYFTRRRANTALVGLACSSMGPTCFCTSMGSAPDDGSDMDVMLYPLGDEYLVEAVSAKGEALLEAYALRADVASPEALARRAEFVYEPGEAVRIPKPEAWRAHFDDAYWDQAFERCLSCRICAYVCPTCRCFDVRDEALPGTNGHECFERIRCWDSCAGEAYRRIAGGHNPRAAKGQRLRNRFLCKFDYFPRQYALQTAACTGCGRCIDACPVNIDIVEVMQHMVEVSR